MTLDNAYLWLELGKRPFWKLYAREGMGAYELVAEYVNENEDGTTATAKAADLMNDSLAQFNSKVSLFKGRPNLTLKLTAKTAAKSNVDTQTGFVFKFDEEPAQPQNGVSGMGQIDRVLAQNDVYHERMREVDRELHKLDTERLLFEAKKEAFAKEVEAERARLKELEEEYTKNSNRVRKGVEAALGNKLDGLLELAGLAGQTQAPGGSLAGTEEAEERNPRELVIEKIAAYIDENVPGFAQVVWLEKKIVSIVEDQKANQESPLENVLIPEA